MLKQGLVFLVCFMGSGFTLPSYGQSFPQPLLETRSISLMTDKGEFQFIVEIADDSHEIQTGLMGRVQMPDDTGMLFDFGYEQPVSFWMKNTFIPLDMVFLSEEGLVSGIHLNAQPFDETPINSDSSIRYVLEINAGIADSISLDVGDRLYFRDEK